MLVLPKGENQFKRSEKRMELKGITCRIPLELHNRISEESRKWEAPWANSSNDYPRAL